MKRVWVLWLVVFTVFTVGAAEKYYRWVDEEGQVHFSSKSQDERAEELQLRTPGRGTAVPGATGQQDTKAGNEPEPEPEPAVEQARRQANCETAREQIASYSTGRRVRYKDESGEYQYLTEQRRAQWLEDSRRVEQEFCN